MRRLTLLVVESQGHTSHGVWFVQSALATRAEFIFKLFVPLPHWFKTSSCKRQVSFNDRNCVLSSPAPVPCRPAPAATCSVCSSWSNSGAPGTSGQSGSSSSDPAAAGPMCRPHPGPGSGPAAPAPAPGSAVPKVAPGPDCHSRLPGLLAGRLRLPQRQKLHYPFSGKLRGAAVVGSGLVVNCPEGEHQSVRSFPFSLLGG